VISVTGTLNTVTLAAPRLLFAMAEQGQLPRVLAVTHRRFRTPYVAILISAAIMLVLTLQGAFISALTISTITRLLAYIVTCLALPVLRHRSDVPPPGFKAPAGTAVSIAAAGLSVWLLSNSSRADARSVGLVAALGMLIYLAYRLLKRAPHAAKEIESVNALPPEQS